MNLFRLCKMLQESRNRCENMCEMGTEERKRPRGPRDTSMPMRELKVPMCVISAFKDDSFSLIDTDIKIKKKDGDVDRECFPPFNYPIACSTRHHNFHQSFFLNNFCGLRIPYKDNDKENNINIDHQKKMIIKNCRSVAMKNRRKTRSSNSYEDIRHSFRTIEAKKQINQRLFGVPIVSNSVYYSSIQTGNGYLASHKQYDISSLTSGVIKTITDKISFMIIQNFMDPNLSYQPFFFYLNNILPIYLISGYVYLRRYLNCRLKDLKKLFKIFISCCWIAIKVTNDTHVTCNQVFGIYNIDPEEISFIEAHILSKINYDIEISKEEIYDVIG
ncbi:hypothetical protein NGRA_1372 [Nosema granulosis]|uniref:Cyclin N-terminal domain-containing protein n=1 Tax=Nosema granulosis TaxID=83296 RepID=A0A9P6GZL7_9MICR|nr:hypothetical protein NGRA_1372 [Nosema granulosis]